MEWLVHAIKLTKCLRLDLKDYFIDIAWVVDRVALGIDVLGNIYEIRIRSQRS